MKTLKLNYSDLLSDKKETIYKFKNLINLNLSKEFLNQWVNPDSTTNNIDISFESTYQPDMFLFDSTTEHINFANDATDEDSDITFTINDEEVLKITTGGKFYIRGILTDEDDTIIEEIKKFIIWISSEES